MPRLRLIAALLPFSLGPLLARTSAFPVMDGADAVSGFGTAVQGPTPCLALSDDPLAPSRDLYCIDLVPVPGLSGVTGTFELDRIPSPFGTNVTEDGAQVYSPVLRLSGLPQPSAFASGAAVWVAWITGPSLYPYRKLGEVDNGETVLPDIDWSKFLVLVTAEPSAGVDAPDGRIALRGFSPSSRMQPPDFIEFLYGAGRSATSAAPDDAAAPHSAGVAAAGLAGGGDHAHGVVHAGPPDPAGTNWIRPPMPPGLLMMPAEMELPPPAATPFLPPDALEIPDARPRELVLLEDGDTLVLTAGHVRQRVNGRSFVGYGYNGQVPGPVLSAPRGATVHVRYRNDIDWATAVHWHGIRLENRFDGAAGVTQPPVAPGAEFLYSVRLPDAGLFWYHPHGREDVLKDLGLFGNILVRADEADSMGPADREEFLVLDDMEIADGGPIPYGAERATHALMGRFGNVPLLNGVTDWSYDVKPGEVVRFLITNVANARTFNLSFSGAPMKVVGADVGRFEREERVGSIVVAPAERYIVHVHFPEPGVYAIENRILAIDHTFGEFFQQVDTLGIVRVSGESSRSGTAAEFERLREHPDVIAEIEPLRSHFDREPDRYLLVRLETGELPFMVDRFLRFDSVYFHPVEWGGTMPMMNWNTTPEEIHWILEDPETGLRNMDIRWDFEVGQLVKIRISNIRETLHAMQHPIHFHGQRFLVLEQNGVRNTNLAWKDTFLLPAGSTADIRGGRYEVRGTR